MAHCLFTKLSINFQNKITYWKNVPFWTVWRLFEKNTWVQRVQSLDFVHFLARSTLLVYQTASPRLWPCRSSAGCQLFSIMACVWHAPFSRWSNGGRIAYFCWSCNSCCTVSCVEPDASSYFWTNMIFFVGRIYYAEFFLQFPRVSVVQILLVSSMFDAKVEKGEILCYV